MVFEDLYKKNMFFKDDMFFFKITWQKKYMFFVVDKTKQKLLFKNYECFSKKEKKYQELIFAEGTYLSPLWVQVQPIRAWY